MDDEELIDHIERELTKAEDGFRHTKLTWNRHHASVIAAKAATEFLGHRLAKRLIGPSS